MVRAGHFQAGQGEGPCIVFIELVVGMGASRVRDISKQAKEMAPCIVFINEFDAIGRQRGAGIGGGNVVRESIYLRIHIYRRRPSVGQR
jgi:hypothetical protein